MQHVEYDVHSPIHFGDNKSASFISTKGFWSNVRKHLLREGLWSPGVGYGSATEAPLPLWRRQPKTPWGYGHGAGAYKSAFLVFLVTNSPAKSNSPFPDFLLPRVTYRVHSPAPRRRGYYCYQADGHLRQLQLFDSREKSWVLRTGKVFLVCLK